MADREHPPRLQPPPRVGVAENDPVGTGNAERGLRAGFYRRAVFGSVFAALTLGLAGVFLVLPKWQDQRMNTVEAIQPSRRSVPTQAPAIAPTPLASAKNPPVPQEPQPVATKAQTPSVPAPFAPPPTRGPSRTQKDFTAAMSQGLLSMEQGQWTAAAAALDRAARIKPNAPEVVDALAQLRALQRRSAIAEGIRHASELEDAERWREATDAYSAVLAADPESAAALDGRDRASRRADLDEKLEYHISNPGRLTTPSVLEDAAALFEEVQEIEPGGPRLAAQTSRLGTLIELASRPLEVTLESDNLTEVTVYQVGRLGAFATHQLKLRPGAYTAVGSRAGYRDVRVRFAVMPGTPIKPIVIRCTESL